MNIPKEYIPTSLRTIKPPPPIAYAIGEEISLGEFGFWGGPFPDIVDCLEQVGVNEKDRIVRVGGTGPDTAVWAWNRDRWVEILPPDPKGDPEDFFGDEPVVARACSLDDETCESCQ